ncbi:DUF5658 family protein [Thermoanaerobacter mathranii]|uniref:DUF5658 family protein n=1 Tax=Thermoanaerobacter mathranii TaxID=583357 RepID=UPI003D6B420C
MKLLYLLLLNAADGFLTYYGTILGIIKEANPLMRTIVNNPVKFFSVKIVLLSAVLLTAWLTLGKNSSLLLHQRFWYLTQQFLHTQQCFFCTFTGCLQYF